MNNNEFCYQCSKYGPEFLFGNLKINDRIDEPYFPAIEKKLCEYKTKTRSKEYNTTKI